MKHIALIAPTANAQTAQINATEADKIMVNVTQTLGVGETVTFFLPTSTNSTVPVYTDAGTAAALTPTLSSIMLEGGVLYIVTKSATAAPTGVDYHIKPRIGPH